MPSSRPTTTAIRLLGLALGLAALIALGACGSEIGDACAIGGDCSPDGDRVCLRSSEPAQPDYEGYCTVVGCDHDTCPDEAVCIRFFSGLFSNKTCDPDTEDADDPTTADMIEGTDSCSLDELCSLQGYCALRASEVRFCMRSCSDGGDCRSKYECRNLEGMKARGGEPVLPPGERVGTDPARFCVAAP